MFITTRLKRVVDLALTTRPGYRRRAGLRSRTLLVMSILLVGLIVTLSSYAGEAFAQGAKDADFVKAYPHAQVMLDIIDGAVARPRHPRYREISEIIQTESLTAINAQKNPKQAITDIAGQIKPLVA